MVAHGSLATENEMLQLKFAISNMGKIFKLAFSFYSFLYNRAFQIYLRESWPSIVLWLTLHALVQGIFKFAYITPFIFWWKELTI